MKLSKNVEQLLKRAIDIASNFKLNRITTLAIISASMKDSKFRRILSEASKSSVEVFKLQLERFLSERKDDPEESDPTEVREVKEFIDDAEAFSNSVITALSYAKMVSLEEQRNEITVDDFLFSVLSNEPKNLKDLFRMTETDGDKITQFYRDSGKRLKIPESISSFVTVLNDKFKNNTDCAILGREKEINQIWQTLQKKTKRNLILVGKPGTGKSSIIEKLTCDIINYRCPPDFEEAIVLSLDVNALIAGTSLRGEAEERYKALIEFVRQNKNVILFIDEIHMIVGAGACSGKDNQDFSNALKPLLAGDDSMVIGATTTEEYKRTFEKQGALSRRFRTILVREPKSDEVYPMLKDSIKQLANFHGVTISRKMVDFIILNSSCFHYNTANPDRTKDLIDLSMVAAKMAGKKRVDKKSVLTNFRTNFGDFKKMSPERKMAVAYHEVGHYLVWRFSGRLVNEQVIAISIIPAEDYLGVNVFDATNEVVADDFDYFIDRIAMCLAGRVSEKMYTDSYSSGASGDLKKATKMAYDMITKFGMSEFGKNRVFINEKGYFMQTERIGNLINEEIDAIIQKAYERAENILKRHRGLQAKLVDLLLQKGIINKKEIDETVKNFDRFSATTI